MRLLTQEELPQFVAEKMVAVILFYATWDNYRDILRKKLLDAEVEFEDHVNFGEVDCDREPELAASVPVANVPLVAYYRVGHLVAGVIGANQDVQESVERTLRGQLIGTSDRRTAIRA